jgi:hypothetical protein
MRPEDPFWKLLQFPLTVIVILVLIDLIVRAAR